MIHLRQITGDRGPGWEWHYYDSPDDPELRVMVTWQDGRLQIDVLPLGRYALKRDLESEYLQKPWDPHTAHLLRDSLEVSLFRRSE